MQSEAEWNAEQLLRSSAELFMWLRNVRSSALSEKACGVLQARWLDWARKRRLLLSTPRLALRGFRGGQQ